MRDIRTHLKLAGLICGTGLALAAMLACGLNLWLKSAAGAATALELVNRSLPGRIDAVRIRIELFAGHIELDDASLSGPDGRRIIGCPRISLDLDLLALLGRRLVISRLELAGPQARLILEDDGQLNLVKAFKKPDAPKSDFVVEINQLQAAAADVRFESAAGRLRARASQTELKLAARFGDGYRLDLAVPRARLSLSQARHDFELGTVATALRLSPAGLNDLSFNASRGASRLRLDGSLMNPGQRLKARLDFDLAPRDFYPSLEPTVPGRFSGWLTAGGSLVKPELATAIRHSGGDFKGFKLGPAELKAELNNRLLRLDLLKAGYASGLVTVKGQADLGQAWPADGPLKPAAIAYRLNLAGADLALDGLPKIPRQLNGRGLESLSFAARLKARGLSWSGRLKPTGLDLNASGAYAAKRLELKRLTIAAPGANLEGRGHYDTASKNLGAELELTSPDLASLLSPCGLKARGSLGLAAGLSGNLKAPRASFALIGRALGNERLMLGDVSGRARLEPTGWLEVDELELDNRGSRLKATGRLRLFDGFPHLSPGRQFDARAEALDLNPQDFYAASPVAARLNGTLALNACSTQDIRGAARLTGHNLAVRGHELGRLDLTAALADDWLELAGLNLASNSSTLNAHGRLRLTRANLRQSELAELKLAGRLSLEDFDPHCRGALDLDADLSGRLAEPQGQASVSASALEIHGQALAGLHLDATLADQRLNVPNLRCDLGAGHALEGSGWLELNGDYALRAISQNLRLEDLAVLDKAGLTGALTAELSGQGRLKDPSLQLNLTASDLRHTPSLQRPPRPCRTPVCRPAWRPAGSD